MAISDFPHPCRTLREECTVKNPDWSSRFAHMLCRPDPPVDSVAVPQQPSRVISSSLHVQHAVDAVGA